MNFDKTFKNIDKILSKCPTVTIGIMCTYNAFSVLTFDKLIKGVYEYKKKYS
jgi:hypothetical protein